MVKQSHEREGVMHMWKENLTL